MPSIMTDSLTEFIQNNASHLSVEVTEETSLLERGLLDSLLLVNLIAFLERRYGVEIPDEEIVPENFKSLSAIRALIERLAPDL